MQGLVRLMSQSLPADQVSHLLLGEVLAALLPVLHEEAQGSLKAVEVGIFSLAISFDLLAYGPNICC